MALLVLALIVLQIVFFQKYSIKDIIFILVTTIPIAISALNSGSNNLLSTWLFILAAKYIDFEDIVKISYVVLLITIPIILFMFFSGYIIEITMMRNSIVRHSWGFSHPNWLGMRVFQVVIAHCYIFRKRPIIFRILIILFASYFVYRVPNCQTALYALLLFALLLVLDWASGLVVDGHVFLAKALVLVAIAANALSVIMSFTNLRKGTLLFDLDRMLSRRFSQCHRTMEHFGISLLGKEINLYTIRMNSSVQIFHLDTAYMTILLRYGVIVYAIFSVFFIVTMIKCVNKNRFMLIIIYCMYAIYGMMEKNFFMMSQNIFLFAMSYSLYSREFIADTVEINREKVMFKLVNT
jgi:hypothetical protein